VRDEFTPRNGAQHPDGLRQGVLSGLLLAIPFWMAIGIGVVVFFLRRPFETADIVALVIAGAVEMLLVFVAWRRLGWRFGLRPALAWAVAGVSRVNSGAAQFKHSALLAGLVVSYLHYYYWEVQTQIAMLPSVTVFVTVAGNSARIM